MNQTTPAGPQAQEAGVSELLAQEIRRVDGNHSLGAAALADALMPFITSLTPARVVSDDALNRAVHAWDVASFVDGEGTNDSMRAALEAALSTLQSGAEGRDGWLPIESAPRDGTYVLLYDAGRTDTYLIGRWRAMNQGWWGRPTLSGKSHLWNDDPTHWKPLNPPTTALQPGQEEGS